MTVHQDYITTELTDKVTAKPGQTDSALPVLR